MIPSNAFYIQAPTNLNCTTHSTGTRPYCATFTYGADYRSFVCMSEKDVEYQMEPYWEGFSDPIAFPVYTGSSGISTGTQYPLVYSKSSSSTSSDLASGTRADTGYTSSSTEGNTGSSSDHGGSSPVGAIVGGVIGGLAFLSLVVGAIILFLCRGRRQQNGQPQRDNLGFQNGHEPNAQSPHPPSSTFSNVLTYYKAIPNHSTSEAPAESHTPHQSPPYEIYTQYTQSELVNSGQYVDQGHMDQPIVLPGAQRMHPEYMSAAQGYSGAELDSTSGNVKTVRGAGLSSGGYQGVRRDVHEAPWGFLHFYIEYARH